MLECFRRILNVYNVISIEKRARLIGFKTPIDLEQGILDLPNIYRLDVSIKGNTIIIQKNIIEHRKREKEGKKSEKILNNEDFKKYIETLNASTEFISV
jgi:hypothetical protein